MSTPDDMLPANARCYLVGGAVRDAMLDLEPNERDWVVLGVTPEQMQAAGFRPVGKDFPVFLHPRTKCTLSALSVERQELIQKFLLPIVITTLECGQDSTLL